MIVDRAEGALVGLAIGDALGMPTQLLPHAEVRERYGVVDDFHAGADDQPVAPGRPAGSVTDDTDQALIIARLLIAGDGQVDTGELVTELLDWQRRMSAAGSLDLLGPSTTRALDAIARGTDPAVAGRWGDTNGAAMRVAPLGVAYAAEPLERLLDAVAEASRPTHGTSIAIAGASAVAAAVSVGIGGGSMRDAIDRAIVAAVHGAERGAYAPGGDVAARIGWAIDLTRGRAPDELLSMIDRLVGTSVATQEAVPAAFALLAAFPDDPWAVVRHAATLGGDSDTIAAMAGAVAGAVHGASAYPAERRAALETANPDLGITELAAGLLALRETEP